MRELALGGKYRLLVWLPPLPPCPHGRVVCSTRAKTLFAILAGSCSCDYLQIHHGVILQPYHLQSLTLYNLASSSLQVVVCHLYRPLDHLFFKCTYIPVANFIQSTVPPYCRCITNSRRRSREFHVATYATYCFPTGRVIPASSGGQSSYQFIRSDR